jgi:methionine synthase II (cobalamin-independent)
VAAELAEAMDQMAGPPPFRADHVGSLLRPPALLDMRRRAERGEASAADLAEAENRAIAEAVALQERVGLKLATDGEFRRRSYHSYFYRQLGDIVPDYIPAEARAADGRGAQPRAVINSKLKWTHPIHVDDYRLLASLTRATPKITIPGPCALHFRGGDAAVTATAYDDVAEFWDDTVAAFRAELNALAEAGCTYVQIDETAFAKFGDADVQAMLAARGDDWRGTIDRYIAVTNRVLKGLPETLHVGMHLCRGNRGGEGKIRVIALARDLESIRTQTVRTLVANAGDLAARPDVYKRFIAAYREIIDWMYSDPKAPEMYAAYARIRPEMAKTVRDKYYPKAMHQIDRIEGMKEMMDDAVAFKYMPKPLTDEQQKELLKLPGTY